MSGLKLVGEDVTAEPNYPSCLVSSIGQAAAFSQKIGFLTHAVFAMGVHKGEPNVLKGAYKGLMPTEELEAATRIVLKHTGQRMWKAICARTSIPRGCRPSSAPLGIWRAWP